MSAEPVAGWDAAYLLAGESTWGTVPNPAAAQSFEAFTLKTGPSAQGDTRGQKDRNPGRGMQKAFVEGRQKPIPWSLETSVKSRAAVDTTPRESALYRAGGLTETVNSSTSVVYTLGATPQQTANSFASLSLYRVLGKGVAIYEAEQLRGGIVKTLSWHGGDSELVCKAAGEAIDKYHLGYAASVTLANGSDTSLVFATAEEAGRFGIGWYQIESEVIKITAQAAAGGTTATIARAQLSTSGAAHSSKPITPYTPSLSYAGSPISEGGTVTVTLNSVTLRCMSFDIDLTTGVDMLPGESGSKYVQGAKFLRYDLTGKLRLVLAREQVTLLGNARNRDTVALSIVQSTGSAGGVVTFSMPYCEVMPMETDDAPNDEVICDVSLRVRDNSGNDAFTYTAT